MIRKSHHAHFRGPRGAENRNQSFISPPPLKFWKFWHQNPRHHSAERNICFKQRVSGSDFENEGSRKKQTTIFFFASELTENLEKRVLRLSAAIFLRQVRAFFGFLLN